MSVELTTSFDGVADPGEGPARGEARGAAVGNGPRATRPTLRRYVPTCSNNGLDGGDELCSAALNSCPVEGQVQFWPYTSRWDAGQVPPAYGPWVQDTDPPAVCLDPQAAQDGPAVQVDPRVLVAAQVRRDWRTYGLPPAVVRISPAEMTLTGAVTRFGTDTAPSAVLRRTVLGLPVALTVTARSYTWRFGDGTAKSTAATGSPPTAQHTYTATGAVGASLSTVYSGTFTIGEDPQTYQVEGTATVPGDPQPLQVRQARSQLVDD